MKTKEWIFEIRHPSGERDSYHLKSRHRNLVQLTSKVTAPISETTDDCTQILLRDSEIFAQPIAISLDPSTSKAWLLVPSSQPPARVADLNVRSGELPLEQWFQVGNTRILLRTTATDSKRVQPPELPESAKPWLTTTSEGTTLLWETKKTAPSRLPVYIEGETGVGKELIAHLVHLWSGRAAGPFVPINCGALVATLAESELFGHTKGAFTGADRPRPGALMQAHNGTLFLDEVGDLSLDLQVKLLRFLENGEIRPVGADRRTHIDVRVVCATHKPLEKLVEKGAFRKDLYYRLSSLQLRIPPLRDRAEDIEFLARHFAEKHGHSISRSLGLHLRRFPWPGNVRQLIHSVERAATFAGAERESLRKEDFSFLQTGNNFPTSTDNPNELTTVLPVRDMQKILLIRALQASQGNRNNAAKMLGVARSTVFELIRRYGLSRVHSSRS